MKMLCQYVDVFYLPFFVICVLGQHNIRGDCGVVLILATWKQLLYLFRLHRLALIACKTKNTRKNQTNQPTGKFNTSFSRDEYGKYTY